MSTLKRWLKGALGSMGGREAEELGLRGGALLKISAQGAELDVLEGGRHLLETCEVAVVETSLFRFRPRFPDFYDVVAFMKDRGYVVYDIVAGRNRPYDGALAHRYLIFARENGRFRAKHQRGKENAHRAATISVVAPRQGET
jgi:hypothetical protein